MIKPWDTDYEMPHGDIEFLTKVHNSINEHKNEINNPKSFFFQLALEPYYCPLYDGMDKVCLDLVYRLSDKLSYEERDKIMVYPSNVGSILDFDEKSQRTIRWDSLEDWRREWKITRRGHIPELIKLLEIKNLKNFKIL